MKDVSVLSGIFQRTQVEKYYYAPIRRNCRGKTDRRLAEAEETQRAEAEDIAERRAEHRFTRNPEKFFFASAFSRVALSADLVFL